MESTERLAWLERLELRLSQQRRSLEAQHVQLLAEMRVADAVAELSVDTDVPDDTAPAMPAVEAEAAVAVPSSASHMFKPIALNELDSMMQSSQEMMQFKFSSSGSRQSQRSGPSEVSKVPSKEKPRMRLTRSASSLKESLTAERVPSVQRPCWHPVPLVQSFVFEVFFACLIFLQAVAMAVEVQYTGLDWGHRLQYDGYDSPAAEIWPVVPEILRGVEFVFGVCFGVEVVLKFCGLGKEYLRDPWCWFDAALVGLWVCDMALSLVAMNTPHLRLIRLVRLLRLVKLVRAIRGFDSLIVMTTALQDSVNALLWVAVIMVVVELLFALLLNQILVSLVGQDARFSMEDEMALFQYFGTFPRCMLTMFQFTLGTWVPVARVLQEIVSPVMNIFTILHKVTIGFACIGVINGVFMQETMKVAQSDDVIMMRDVARREKIHAQKMKTFFQLTDQSGDSNITRAEWVEVMARPATLHWFAAQGLSMQDPEAVFDLLDSDGSDSLTLEELVAGVSKLQGPARGLDLALLSERQRSLQDLVRRMFTVHNELVVEQERDRTSDTPPKCSMRSTAHSL
ncbi:unnamed protein product [Effrenium voratum]|uniref:EF-hand domain-containing protein n=1 Tax=Effrenium voratum TaxID=2562239 RepID=A0AA36IT88_9DINO|nr:unnamed protein product [Effrenium voratum]